MAPVRRPKLEQKTTPGACEACERWALRYERLVNEMISLKRDGFVPASAVLEAPKQEQIPQEIHAAIGAVAFDSVTRTQLYERARQELRAGVPADELAHKIEAGEEVPY